jgi:polyisoprenoid-binding protein YceI
VSTGISFARGIEKSERKMTSINKVFKGLLVLLLMAGCSSAPSGDKATITEEQTTQSVSGAVYQIDTADSKVKFTGHGVGKKHPGNFRVGAGTVAIENNRISGGSFIIMINSLEMDEKGDMFEKKLKPHLLSGDFFDATKFSTAKFEITGVEPYDRSSKDSSVVDGANFNVSGNLTIKDVTRNITFPAKVDLDGNKLKGKADFDIDRTQWKLNYGSDKTLGDKFISPTVNIKLDLVAVRDSAATHTP